LAYAPNHFSVPFPTTMGEFISIYEAAARLPAKESTHNERQDKKSDHHNGNDESGEREREKSRRAQR
jgi:hypothetical protein